MEPKVLTDKMAYENFANLIVDMLKESGIDGLVEMLAGGAGYEMIILRPEMIHYIEAVFEREFGFLYEIPMGRKFTGENLLEELCQDLSEDPILFHTMENRWRAIKEQEGAYGLPIVTGDTRSGGGL